MEHDLGQVYIQNGALGRAAETHGDDGGPLAFPSGEGGMGYSSVPVADIRLLARDFLKHFRIQNDFLYLRMLHENLSTGSHFIEIEMSHLQQFHAVLGQAVQSSPVSALPLLEQAVWETAVERKWLPQGANLVAAAAAATGVMGASGSASSSALASLQQGCSIQVQLFWDVPPSSIRQLAQALVGKLVCVSGIVVKISASHHRCTRAALQCTSCRSKTFISGRRGLVLPQQCLQNGAGGGGNRTSSSTHTGGGGGGGGGGGTKRCRPNPYVMLPMECQYEDQQVLKIQELPEDVPTGELPRHVTVVLDRYLVDRISPGSRVHIVGIVSVQEQRNGSGDLQDGGKKKSSGGGAGRASTAGLRAQYLRAVGIMFCSAHELGESSLVSVNQSFSSRVRLSRSVLSWTPEEEVQFKAFAKSPNVYETLSNSIDPAIFGLTDQKKAVVCLLIGGTRKKNGSNYLRGDMNVLFIGDPSTAKSQLLKFTEKVAPIGIYTSGKGSSAAGLTASVVSTGKGDFALEAGSMVLADGGVVCIDEFDKMREQDQVVIHEAMEQQTISIAKANLTTMLNSRTSVLAAANPSMGSYDPTQSNEDQMDFASSILSRFDLIFKVLDPRNAEMDLRLAHHVVYLHKNTQGSGAAGEGGSGGGRRRRGGGGGGGGGGMSGSGGRRVGTSAWARHLPGGAASRVGAGGTGEGGRRGADASGGPTGDATHEVLDRRFLTKYIAYARATCFPVISEEAMTTLLDFYVQVRRDSHRQNLEALSRAQALNSSGSVSDGSGKGDGGGGGRGAGTKSHAFSSSSSSSPFSSSSSSHGSATPIIQITARQLESMVRITESQAKMRLDVLASRKDAEEAIRLFKSATVDAMNSGVLSAVDPSLSPVESDLILRVEEAVRRGIPIGSTVDYPRLLSEMARRGFAGKMVDRAVSAMLRREEIVWRKQRTVLYRIR